MTLSTHGVAGALLAAISVSTFAQIHPLSPGWNLIANDTGQEIATASIFGIPTATTSAGSTVISVWAWDAKTARWGFFSPSLSDVALASYSTSNGYSVLNQIPIGAGFWVNSTASTSLNLSNSAIGTGYPIAFEGLILQTIETIVDRTYCDAKLTFKNGDTKSLSPYLYFDVVVNGVTVNQTIFSTSSLAPGAIASDSNTILANSKFLTCGTFSLVFNAAASHVYNP